MSEVMDNFCVRVVAQSKEALKRAIELGCSNVHKIVAWNENMDDEGRLWLSFYWDHTQDIHLFPTELTTDDALSMISRWLEKRKPVEKEPDIDGSVRMGFELVTVPQRTWSYEIFRVRPIWVKHHNK